MGHVVKVYYSPMVSVFCTRRDSDDEPVCPEPIKIPIDDNTKFSIAEYRNKLYAEIKKKKKDQKRKEREAKAKRSTKKKKKTTDTKKDSKKEKKDKKEKSGSTIALKDSKKEKKDKTSSK